MYFLSTDSTKIRMKNWGNTQSKWDYRNIGGRPWTPARGELYDKSRQEGPFRVRTREDLKSNLCLIYDQNTGDYRGERRACALTSEARSLFTSAGALVACAWRRGAAPIVTRPTNRVTGGLYGDSLTTFGFLSLALKGLVNKYQVACSRVAPPRGGNPTLPPINSPTSSHNPPKT